NASTTPSSKPANASVSVTAACCINSGKSPTNASNTLWGEGSINEGTKSKPVAAAQMSTTIASVIAGESLLMMLCNFLVNGQNTALRLVGNLDISRHRRRTGTNCNMLTFFHNVQKLVVILALNGGLKRADRIVKPCAFDVVDDLIDNSHKLVRVGNAGQNLNGYACLHKTFLRFQKWNKISLTISCIP